MSRNLLLLLLFPFTTVLSAQNGCPGCIVSLPDSLSADTIYLGEAPNGQVGVYYDSDLSFRMPKTTTPVNATDPDTPPGLTISQITILSVSNLPPGLSWQANQAQFNPAQQTDGCGKLCGVPLIPGFYNVEVIVEAQIFVLSQTTAFTFPVLILPGTSVTDGFTLENNSGCGSVTSNFINNVPSGGQDGYSYFWDFGNGNQSVNENPVPQTYTEPGVYEIQYEAQIDTFGYLLTEVVVESVACNDVLNGAPDLRVEIWDPSGVRIMDTPHIQNAQTPVAFTLNIFIGPGNYLLRVMDEDSGLEGGDDECGTVNFTQNSNGFFASGSLEASLTIIHPVDTILSVDTVIVYEQPETPVLSSMSEFPFCAGDTLLLSTDELDGLQWYQDSLPILGADSASFQVVDNGSYWVIRTTPDGCSATSEVADVAFPPLPVSPVFQNFDNLLTFYDPGSLPDIYQLRWFRNGVLISGASNLDYCVDASGSYTLEVTDLSSGCASTYSLEVSYNPNFPGCMPTATAEPSSPFHLTAFPNPTSGVVNIQGTIQARQARLRLYNAQGQWLAAQTVSAAGGLFSTAMDLSSHPAGLYWLAIQADGRTEQVKVVKQ